MLYPILRLEDQSKPFISIIDVEIPRVEHAKVYLDTQTNPYEILYNLLWDFIDQYNDGYDDGFISGLNTEKDGDNE